jgi:hypothetical protein
LNYNVAIIGGGIGGLMSAYNLKTKNPNLSVCIIDKGKTLEERNCPASNKKSCYNCKTCDITCGISGAGAYSDGKFCIGTSYGGTLSKELGEDLALDKIEQTDKILTSFVKGTLPKVYSDDDGLRLKCLQNNLRLLNMNVRHYGTDGNQLVMSNLYDFLLEKGVVFFTETNVDFISKLPDNEDINWCVNHDIFCEYLIIATGRGGSKFVTEFCKDNDIKMSSNNVDIGVRVEMPDEIWKEFSDKIYEPKILYKTKTFEDQCRMFCFNKGGIVSAENNNGVVTANGHAYSDSKRRTGNCNFAILSSIGFTEPFDSPTEYAENISRLANLIGNGNVIVQRFGDLIRGRRSTEKRLTNNSVYATMKAVAGDISLVLPHRILTNIIETIYAFDKVAKGTANDDTLLYACESKYYSVRPEFINDSFEVSDGAFIIGDGSGISRGLAQAGAMGLICSDKILGE